MPIEENSFLNDVTLTTVFKMGWTIASRPRVYHRQPELPPYLFLVSKHHKALQTINMPASSQMEVVNKRTNPSIADTEFIEEYVHVSTNSDAKVFAILKMTYAHIQCMPYLRSVLDIISIPFLMLPPKKTYGETDNVDVGDVII